MTVEELLAALEASDFDALAGVSEDGSIDFKGQPYLLGREDQKYELAKDVASPSAEDPEKCLFVIVVPPQRESDKPFLRCS